MAKATRVSSRRERFSDGIRISILLFFLFFLIFLNNSAYIPFFKENQGKQIFFVTESKNRGDPSALFRVHI